MSERVYTSIEVTRSSPHAIDTAIRTQLPRPPRLFRNLGWFEVVGIRGHLADGGVDRVQVTLKLGFRLG
jgi:flavin-binding protein dodecin